MLQVVGNHAPKMMAKEMEARLTHSKLIKQHILSNEVGEYWKIDRVRE